MARTWIGCTSACNQRPASSTLLIYYLLYFHLNLLCNTKLFCSHPTPKITGTIYPGIVNTGTRYELLHGAVTYIWYYHTNYSSSNVPFYYTSYY